MANDYNNKRYYWIKLKDTFFTSDTVDFLMSQKDGANYVVLYQMLCLKTANTNGELSRQIGEIIIPFDVEKIHRYCKYFSIDTIRVALELYKKLGLIYEQENGILQITNFENLIGSESQNAVYKRKQREEEKRLESVQQMSNKILDNRDKILDNRDNNKKEKFTPPTVDEVREYCIERGNNIDAEAFCDWYESVNWFVGKNKMKDWRAAVRTWERKDRNQNNNYNSYNNKSKKSMYDLLDEAFKD